MTRWTADDLPDLSGSTVVVTGASNGLGLVTARHLAERGAHVVLAVRTVARGEAAARSIAGSTGSTEVRELDLASLASVRRFAADWSGPLDVLINNAGIMMVPEGRSPEGFELHLATNFLGPFALTTLLLPHITDRVVTVSSQLHRLGRIRLDDMNATIRGYDALAGYNDSKLADTLFGIELQRRLTAQGSAVRSIVAHPGIARTTLVTHAGARPGLLNKIAGSTNRLGPLLNDVEHGALPTLYAATADVAGGSYVGPDGPLGVKGYPKVGTPSRAARDPELAGRLWDLAVELTGVPEPVV